MTAGWNLKEARNPQPKEIDRLFDAAKKEGAKSHLMIVLTYNGALRVCELVHIRVEDFSWATGSLSIIPAKKAGRRRKKSADGEKVIEKPLPPPIDYPMPAVAMDLAQEYIRKAKLKDGWLFPGRTSSCPVVGRRCQGGHVSKRDVQKMFDRLANAAGIKKPGRGIHALKHARLTEVAQKTRDPYLVKEIGRHESVAMSDHYVRYVNLKDKVREIGGKA